MINQRLRRWLLCTAVATYGLIVLGAIVSATGSGMGCGPEWPLCNERWIPSLDTRETILEYGHRLAAGIVALLAAASLWIAHQSEASLGVRRLTHAVFGLILLQSLLGAITVWTHLPPLVTLLHLAISQTILGLLVIGVMRLGVAPAPSAPDRSQAARSVRRWLGGATIAVAATVLLGGAVKLYGAGLACGVEFPLCWGGMLPDPGERTVVLHWFHRLAGFTSGLLILGFYWRAHSLRKEHPDWTRGAAVPFALVFVQIALGAVTVWTRLEPWASVAHLGVATLLLVSLLGMLVRTGAIPGSIAMKGSFSLGKPGMETVGDA